jgi:hypothetical protein
VGRAKTCHRKQRLAHLSALAQAHGAKKLLPDCSLYILIRTIAGELLMSAFTSERIFKLSAKGVECDALGLRVGGIELLAREMQGWRVREPSETDSALSHLYGFPVETSAKRAGLDMIATALTNRELARAQIATLFLQLPDPPSGASVDNAELARDLAACGLLKADPDWEAKHPRTGTPPNRAWFANKPKEVEANPASRGRSTWPPKDVNDAIRDWVKRIAGKVTRNAGKLLIDGVPVLDEFALFIETLQPTPANEWEPRAEQQIEANFSTPKTLDELQQRPDGDTFGYELHHIVEQNDSNINKELISIIYYLEKFGRDSIDDDSNTVWIPRLQHEKISAYYNSSPEDEQPFSRFRDYVNTLDFAAQRQAGLAALRRFGVLK